MPEHILRIQNAIPKELQEPSFPFWTTYKSPLDKKPSLPPGSVNQAPALTLEQALTISSNVGILLPPHTQNSLGIIDIDWPKTKSEKIDMYNHILHLNIPQDGKLGSPEHLDLIGETITQISGTSLETLLARTYTEWSPSFTGLRMLVYISDKHRLTKAYKKSTVFQGQLSVTNSFMTITGHRFKGIVDSPSYITTIDYAYINDVMNFTAVKKESEEQHKTEIEIQIENIDSALSGQKAIEQLPAPKTLMQALSTIPLDQSERIVSLWEQLTESKYEHYHFWLSIGMAIHNYAQNFAHKAPLYRAFLEWSQTDPTSFVSETDIQAKWTSFSEPEANSHSHNTTHISWRTIIKLADRCNISYPKPKKDRSGYDTVHPDHNMYVNFEKLLSYFNIDIYTGDGYYVTGEQDALEKYFFLDKSRLWFSKYVGPLSREAVTSACTRLAQDNHWLITSTIKEHVATWLHEPPKPIDMFQEWIDTPFNELPQWMQYDKVDQDIDSKLQRMDIYNCNSTMKYLLSCIHLDYAEEDIESITLAKAMIEKTFMQLIKARDPKIASIRYADFAGMLILVGAENTRKSSFTKAILPSFMSSQIGRLQTELQGEKSWRDFQRALIIKTIVRVDEFEGFFKGEDLDNKLKSLITDDKVAFTDIYQTVETEEPRKAIIICTSNKERHILSRNGSRRMWFVKVKYIDTDRLFKVNWHEFYRNLRDKFYKELNSGQQPWALQQTEIEQLYTMNDSVSKENEIEAYLKEIYDFDQTFLVEYLDKVNVQTYKGEKLATKLEIKAKLEMAGLRNQKINAIEHALWSLCGRWTQTLNTSIPIHKYTIKHGELCQGVMPSGSFKYHRFIMPPEK